MLVYTRYGTVELLILRQMTFFDINKSLREETDNELSFVGPITISSIISFPSSSGRNNSTYGIIIVFPGLNLNSFVTFGVCRLEITRHSFSSINCGCLKAGANFINSDTNSTTKYFNFVSQAFFLSAEPPISEINFSEVFFKSSLIKVVCSFAS